MLVPPSMLDVHIIFFKPLLALNSPFSGSVIQLKMETIILPESWLYGTNLQ
jgi:hypothetical protein